MIAALVWAGLIFYAVLYSGVRQLQGFHVSTIGALRGQAEVPLKARGPGPQASTGGLAGTGAGVQGKCRNPRRVKRHVHPNNVVQLTPGAMRAFIAAERAYGRHILVTGSLRTCSYQERKYDQDPVRFAPPDASAHPRGLAIDVFDHDNDRIKAALRGQGWTQARPGDEPWHWSWGVTA